MWSIGSRAHDLPYLWCTGLVAPHHVGFSWTRDQTHVPCIGRWILKHWNTSEVLSFSSVTQSCPALWEPMDCSMPGFLVHHLLPEFSQTHIHWMGDAIQPSHPLSSPSPPTFNLSQLQGLFQWVSSSHQLAKVSELQLQQQSFQWISGLISFRTDWVWSPCSPRDSQEFSPIPQFKSVNPLALSLLYNPTLTSMHDYWKNHSLD